MAGAHEQDEVRGLCEFYSKGDQRPLKCDMYLTLTSFLPCWFWSPVPDGNSKNRTPLYPSCCVSSRTLSCTSLSQFNPQVSPREKVGL